MKRKGLLKSKAYNRRVRGKKRLAKRLGHKSNWHKMF